MQAKLYITTPQGKMLEETVQGVKDTGVENQVLNIYSEVEDQTLEGFGGALTDAAGYVFSLLSEEQKDELLTKYFAENEWGYNQVRIHMDSCDFSTHLYEADSDENDEKLEKFSFADTERYIIPLLDAAEKKAGKKLNIMLSAWSAPAFMKTNGSRKNGGSLKPEYRKRWAEYLCRYVEEFRSRGYNVVRMSIQNEPKAVQTWDSCVYTAQEEKEFLRDFLAPTFKERGVENIEFFIWDHNKERVYERARDIIDETTNDDVAGIAFHWYSGDHFESLDLVRRVYPGKKLLLSESCLEFSKFESGDQLINAERLAHDMIGNLNHGMVGFYDWNVILDEKGGPNHVGNFCDAPYMFHTDTDVLEERTCLNYYEHFMKFIKPQAVRLAVTRYTDKLDITAWRNTDGEVVFVLLNRSEASLESYVRFQNEEYLVKAPAHSIISGKFVK